MQQLEKIFDNFFTDPVITTARFTNFMGNTINLLTAQTNSGSGDYKPLIEKMTPPYKKLHEQVAGVDTLVNVLKGDTHTNGEVMTLFHNTLKVKQGVIADAVGGFDTPAYGEFYPHGVGEYGKATKEEMPVLTHRINVAADKYKAKLGDTLTALLRSFEPNWNSSRDTQQQQMGSLDDLRADRSSTRTEAELVTLEAVHTIATLFPGNVAQCLTFFDFNLLFTTHKHTKPEVKQGVVPAAGSATAFNKSFTDTNSFIVSNNSENASMLVWLADTEDSDPQPGQKSVEVKATKTRHLNLNNFGGEGGTFLRVKNLSDANALAYKVEVK